jgi:hypothetical protein
MKSIIEHGRLAGLMTRARTFATLSLSIVALSGCDSLLEVELPSELTNEVLEDPVGASMQLNSVIGHFEATFNNYNWQLHGREEGGEIFARSPGTNRDDLAYPTQSSAWFNGFNVSRRFAANLHAKLDKEWTAAQVRDRARYLAITSMYEGASLALLASSLCEITIDDGPMQQPAAIYTLADNLLTRAITEIDASGGDFAVPFGVSTSARTMAYGLRAQLRWMKGDMAGAKADAERVPTGFTAWVTREDVPDRRNRAFEAGGGPGGGRFAEVIGVIDWWRGPANPVTGQNWPNLIPFTGYIDLGILPDGRAVRDDGVPIRRSGTNRTPIEDTSVPDTRVRTEMGIIAGKGAVIRPTNIRYANAGADIPLVNWKEMALIRAEIAGGQEAINLVNAIRTADRLPLVTYANPANATQIKYMILEERRRALWLEGRFFYSKLKNMDVTWFPRGVGITPEGGLQMGGGVRYILPENEYILNENIDLDDRATGCAQHERPRLDV